MKKRSIILILVFLVLLGIGLLGRVVLAPYDDRIVIVGGVYFLVEVPRDALAYQRGLSGRTDLCGHCGMLFVFDVADRYRFWMKDMRFDIDMIWIHEGRVVDLTQNVSHHTPEDILVPRVPVDAVLEVSAGVIAQREIAIGDHVKW